MAERDGKVRPFAWVASLPARFCAGLVRLYQVIVSPLKPRCCRFVPTCSEYAKQAYLTHGFFRGTFLTVWRLLRCHPFYHGDLYDPVPPSRNRKS